MDRNLFLLVKEVKWGMNFSESANKLSPIRKNFDILLKTEFYHPLYGYMLHEITGVIGRVYLPVSISK